MGLVAGNRSLRLVAAAVICYLVFLFFTNGNPRQWADNKHENAPSGLDQNQPPALPDAPPPPPPPPPPDVPPPDAAAASEVIPPGEMKLVDDAHALSTADEFLPHFDAVMQLPGMKMADAKAGCSWTPEQFVNFQFVADEDWNKNERSDDELNLKRIDWHSYVRDSMIPWDSVKDRFAGRGIVVVAGNGDTVSRLKVSLRALVKLGSAIPVEVQYWDDELSAEAMRDLEALYPHEMHFNDLSGQHNLVHIKKDGVFGINYQLKTAALVNSRFAEPLLLDSDNIPVLQPEGLYESATYQEYHSVFWPDIARTRPTNPMWAITNTACRMDEYEQESGQLLVDKTRFWYHLQLASWLNNEQGEYYNKFLLGDKDMFRFAWHALKTKYGTPRKWLTSVGATNDGYYCGNSFAQHHPDSANVAFVHGGLLKTVSPELLKWNREQGGMFRSYKRSSTDEQPSVSINVGIKFDGADYYSPHSEDFHPSHCTDMYDVDSKDINEVLPAFERFFDEVGGYWLLDEAQNATKAAPPEE